MVSKGHCNWIIFFLFLQTKPSLSPLFAWSQLYISATSDSVSRVSEGYQLSYCWILKLLSGPRMFKLLNLCGNQLISIPELLMFLFLLFLGKIFVPRAQKEDPSATGLLLRTYAAGPVSPICFTDLKG
jgi:hypothetical protein